MLLFYIKCLLVDMKTLEILFYTKRNNKTLQTSQKMLLTDTISKQLNKMVTRVLKFYGNLDNFLWQYYKILFKFLAIWKKKIKTLLCILTNFFLFFAFAVFCEKNLAVMWTIIFIAIVCQGRQVLLHLFCEYYSFENVSLFFLKVLSCKNKHQVYVIYF